MERRDTPPPTGGRGTFHNRMRMEDPEELAIVSDVEPERDRREWATIVFRQRWKPEPLTVAAA